MRNIRSRAEHHHIVLVLSGRQEMRRMRGYYIYGLDRSICNFCTAKIEIATSFARNISVFSPLRSLISTVERIFNYLKERNYRIYLLIASCVVCKNDYTNSYLSFFLNYIFKYHIFT